MRPPAVTGGLTRLSAGEWTTWRTADGLPSDYVSDYFRDSRGRRFVLTNSGLAQLEGDRLSRPLEDAKVWKRDTYVWSMAESEQAGLLVATNPFFFQFRDGE